MKKQFFLFFTLVASTLSAGYDRKPFKNYISCDAYRDIAHYIYEHQHMMPWVSPTSPAFLKTQEDNIVNGISHGDIIYVQSSLLDEFFKNVHPKITSSYILISHSGIEVIDKTYLSFLDDWKIIKWFAHNIDLEHEKLIPVPNGIRNRFWLSKCGSPNYASIWEKIYPLNLPRKETLSLHFCINTYPKERSIVYHTFQSNKTQLAEAPESSDEIGMEDFLIDLKEHRFCLSPSGTGISCHRTWEALMLGCIPIIRPMAKPTNSYAKGNDPMYEGLPVIIVKEWSEVTPEFLNKKLEEFERMDMQLEKIYFPYWKNLILSESEKHKREPINN